MTYLVKSDAHELVKTDRNLIFGSQYHLDWLIKGTVIAGADTILKFMGVNYLSQYDKKSEYCINNIIFPFDFKVGYVPFSLSLLKEFNDAFSRFRIHFPYYHKNNEEIEVSFSSNLQANINDLVKNGGLYGKLLYANYMQLQKYSTPELMRRINEVSNDIKI